MWSFIGKSPINGQCSIAMFDYQRVSQWLTCLKFLQCPGLVPYSAPVRPAGLRVSSTSLCTPSGVRGAKKKRASLALGGTEILAKCPGFWAKPIQILCFHADLGCCGKQSNTCIPRGPSTFLGSLWGLIYFDLWIQVASQEVGYDLGCEVPSQTVAMDP